MVTSGPGADSKWRPARRFTWSGIERPPRWVPASLDDETLHQQEVAARRSNVRKLMGQPQPRRVFAARMALPT